MAVRVSIEYGMFRQIVTRAVANEGLRESLSSSFSLAFRLCSEYLVLSNLLGNDVTPGDLAELTDNSPETIRLYLREAEAAGLVEVTQKSGHWVRPTPLLTHLVIEAINRGITKSLPSELKRDLAAGSEAKQNQFNLLALKIIHQWARQAHGFREYRNIFRSPVKRSIFGQLGILEEGTSIAAKSVGQNYNISHESFRTFKNDLKEQGLVHTKKNNGVVYLTPTKDLYALNEKIVRPIWNKLAQEIALFFEIPPHAKKATDNWRRAKQADEMTL
ncbi:MAG: hypothetical protein ACPGGG_00030 [Parvibaculales bacterium]